MVDMLGGWEDKDEELRTRVFQRVNLYAIVATHGWPTAIAATTVTTNALTCFLPPGVQPIVQQPRQQQQKQRGEGRRRNQQPATAAAPAPAPAPASLRLSEWEGSEGVKYLNNFKPYPIPKLASGLPYF